MIINTNLDKARYDLTRLHSDIAEKKLSIEEIKKKWDSCFTLILREWEFNDKAIEGLLKWGRSGGYTWKQLHWDKRKDYREYLSDFSEEIRYCSDSITLDKVFRWHWLLNATLNNYINL